MKNRIELAAKKAGVPYELVDLIGRDFIAQISEDLPNLMLPPIMSTIRREFLRSGLNWVKDNLLELQHHFLNLREMYGSDDSLREVEYHHLVRP